MEKGKSRPLFFPFPFSVSTHRASFFSLSSVSLSTVCREERAKERQTFLRQANVIFLWAVGSMNVQCHLPKERSGSKCKASSFFFAVIVACKQALHLGDILKSSRARGTREEIRVLSRLASLAQIGELARRLP